MKISDTFFSMSRFALLCKKDLMENWKKNLFRLIVMYGALTIIFLWYGYFNYKSFDCIVDQPLAAVFSNLEDSQCSFEMVALVWTLFLMGTISASFLMEPMKTKTSRIAELTLPATPFERFIVRWLVFTVGFLLVYFLLFRLADWTRVAVFSIAYPKADAIRSLPMFDYLVGSQTGHWTLVPGALQLWLLILLYLFVQSLFVLGSALWPKNAFLKTFAVGFILFVVYALIVTGEVMWLTDRHTSLPNFWTLTTSWGAIGVLSVLTIFCWTLAYFRFKESEVINRW
ncbi:MAG: hypothetical protein LBN24_01520 [Mediterranea sp.]|jgi:hypothetical protein|nr:hypothetical protein [Mediterranea sp.]